MGYEENRIGWWVCDLHGKYFFSRDVIFNESVPGHLSPHCGIPVDIVSLPPSSIIMNDNTTISPLITGTHQLNTSTTSLYYPTLTNTICDCDTIINTHTKHTTRSQTNSLPKPNHHYNDIHTITSLIAINDNPPTNLSPHSFENTTYHDLPNIAFLSSPPSSFRYHLPNLSKPPNTYHEVLSRPDKQV